MFLQNGITYQKIVFLIATVAITSNPTFLQFACLFLIHYMFWSRSVACRQYIGSLCCMFLLKVMAGHTANWQHLSLACSNLLFLMRVTLLYRMVICVFRFCIHQLMTLRVENCPVKGGILHRMLGTAMITCSCHIDSKTNILINILQLNITNLFLCFQNNSAVCDIAVKWAQHIQSCERWCISDVQTLEGFKRKR